MTRIHEIHQKMRQKQLWPTGLNQNMSLHQLPWTTEEMPIVKLEFQILVLRFWWAALHEIFWTYWDQGKYCLASKNETVRYLQIETFVHGTLIAREWQAFGWKIAWTFLNVKQTAPQMSSKYPEYYQRQQWNQKYSSYLWSSSKKDGKLSMHVLLENSLDIDSTLKPSNSQWNIVRNYHY